MTIDDPYEEGVYAYDVGVRREDNPYQASAKIAREHELIVVEDLRVAGMTRRARGSGVAQKSGLNRSLLDVAPSTLVAMLAYKCERAGGRLLAVPPHGTSRDCSACGQPVPKPLGERVHACPHCGLTLDRDHNAAINILRRGFDLVAREAIPCHVADAPAARRQGAVVSPRGANVGHESMRRPGIVTENLVQNDPLPTVGRLERAVKKLDAVGLEVKEFLDEAVAKFESLSEGRKTGTFGQRLVEEISRADVIFDAIEELKSSVSALASDGGTDDSAEEDSK